MANWFAYNGTGEIALPGSYLRTSTKPTCVTGGCTICAIYIEDNSSASPSNITSVLTYIANAQVTLSSQPEGGGKKYVYVKC